MQHGAGFRIAGRVSRKPFVVSSGKVAFVSIAVEADGRKAILDLKAFEDQAVAVGALQEGQDVEITGRISAEKAAHKDKTPIQKDGRDLWVPTFVVRAVKVAKRASSPPPAEVDF